MKKFLGLTLVILLLATFVAPPVDAGWERGGHGRWERAPRQEYRGNAGCPACGVPGWTHPGWRADWRTGHPGFWPAAGLCPPATDLSHPAGLLDAGPVRQFARIHHLSERLGGAPDGVPIKGGIMTRVGLLFAVALLTVSLLSGCVIVPLGGWYGGGGHHSPLGTLSVLLPRALGVVRQGVRSPAHSVATRPNALDTRAAQFIYSRHIEGGVDRPAVRRGRQHGRRYGDPASPRGMRTSDRDPSWLIATRGLFIWCARTERGPEHGLSAMRRAAPGTDTRRRHRGHLRPVSRDMAGPGGAREDRRRTPRPRTGKGVGAGEPGRT